LGLLSLHLQLLSLLDRRLLLPLLLGLRLGLRRRWWWRGRLILLIGTSKRRNRQ
jgi:hypothetical protein